MSNGNKPTMCVLDEEFEISEFTTLDQSEVIKDLAKQIKQNNKDISDIEAIKQAKKELLNTYTKEEDKKLIEIAINKYKKLIEV